MSNVHEKSEPLTLVVVVNDQPYLEYDRNRQLDDKQRTGLDHMDRQMNRGIRLRGDWLENPDQVQRAQFVAI